ncbi:MAG TPA: hypothetical protein VHI98_30070 [Vicinamibacterales bacterium]|nr:hypothetical protein [Vicinamibacterales bacterium]
MSRSAYWTIVMEGRPTAFRAGERDDLVPTLKQLQNRHPDTHLMWFQNGRYWRTPLDAIRPRVQRWARPKPGTAAERRGGFDRQRDRRKPGPRGRGPRKDRRRG